MTFYTRLGADSGKIIRQTGKGLIAHGPGNRARMGERINNVHDPLIPCQNILYKEVRRSVQNLANNKHTDYFHVLIREKKRKDDNNE